MSLGSHDQVDHLAHMVALCGFIPGNAESARPRNAAKCARPTFAGGSHLCGRGTEDETMLQLHKSTGLHTQGINYNPVGYLNIANTMRPIFTAWLDVV